VIEFEVGKVYKLLQPNPKGQIIQVYRVNRIIVHYEYIGGPECGHRVFGNARLRGDFLKGVEEVKNVKDIDKVSEFVLTVNGSYACNAATLEEAKHRATGRIREGAKKATIYKAILDVYIEEAPITFKEL